MTTKDGGPAFPSLSARRRLRIRKLWRKASEMPWTGGTAGWDYKRLSSEKDPFYVGNATGPQHYPVRQSDAKQWSKFHAQIQADSEFINALVDAYNDAMIVERNK